MRGWRAKLFLSGTPSSRGCRGSLVELDVGSGALRKVATIRDYCVDRPFLRLAIGQPIPDKNTVYFLMENMRVAKVVDAIGCDVNQVAAVIYAEGNAVWFGVSLTWFQYIVH